MLAAIRRAFLFRFCKGTDYSLMGITVESACFSVVCDRIITISQIQRWRRPSMFRPISFGGITTSVFC
jgi:hypothetical protein